MTARCSVEKVGFIINDQHPWLGCSPDGYVLSENKIIEIKCPYAGKENCLNEIIHKVNYLDSNLKLKKNHPYYTQVQLTMTIVNIQICDFMLYSFAENKCHIETVYLDIEFVEKSVETLKTIYFNNLLPHIYNKHQSTK